MHVLICHYLFLQLGYRSFPYWIHFEILHSNFVLQKQVYTPHLSDFVKYFTCHTQITILTRCFLSLDELLGPGLHFILKMLQRFSLGVTTKAKPAHQHPFQVIVTSPVAVALRKIARFIDSQQKAVVVTSLLASATICKGEVCEEYL